MDNMYGTCKDRIQVLVNGRSARRTVRAVCDPTQSRRVRQHSKPSTTKSFHRKQPKLTDIPSALSMVLLVQLGVKVLIATLTVGQRKDGKRRLGSGSGSETRCWNLRFDFWAAFGVWNLRFVPGICQDIRAAAFRIGSCLLSKRYRLYRTLLLEFSVLYLDHPRFCSTYLSSRSKLFEIGK